MSVPSLIIFLVLLACGIVGGLASHLLLQADNDARTTPWYGNIFNRSVLIGVVAAFVTPLFLNMISSDLLSQSEEQPEKYFVIGGIALLAAVFGKRFLTTVYDQLMKKVETLGKEVEQIGEATDEPDTEARSPGAQGLRSCGIEEPDYKIMHAMVHTRYPSRSLHGLRRSTGLPLEEINTRLTGLISKDFVTQTQSEAGPPRWLLTEPGRLAFDALLPAPEKDGTTEETDAST